MAEISIAGFRRAPGTGDRDLSHGPSRYCGAVKSLRQCLASPNELRKAAKTPDAVLRVELLARGACPAGQSVEQMEEGRRVVAERAGPCRAACVPIGIGERIRLIAAERAARSPAHRLAPADLAGEDHGKLRFRAEKGESAARDDDDVAGKRQGVRCLRFGDREPEAGGTEGPP